MSAIVSRVYQPDPAKCCERCAFGRGAHADFCHLWNPPTHIFLADDFLQVPGIGKREHSIPAHQLMAGSDYYLSTE